MQARDIPTTQGESEELVAETGAMMALEDEYAASLDFGGINTSPVRTPPHSESTHRSPLTDAKKGWSAVRAGSMRAQKERHNSQDKMAAHKAAHRQTTLCPAL